MALLMLVLIASASRLPGAWRPPPPCGEALDWRHLRVGDVGLETSERVLHDLQNSYDQRKRVPDLDVEVRLRNGRVVLVEGKTLTMDGRCLFNAGDRREDVIARLGRPTAGEHCGVWYQVGHSAARKEDVWLLVAGHDEIHSVTLFYDSEDPTR